MDDKKAKLELLADLLSKGAISREEFEAQASKLASELSPKAPPHVVQLPATQTEAKAAPMAKKKGPSIGGIIAIVVFIGVVCAQLAPIGLRIFRDNQPSQIKDGTRTYTVAEARQLDKDITTVTAAIDLEKGVVGEPTEPIVTSLGQRFDQLLRGFYSEVKGLEKEALALAIDSRFEPASISSDSERAKTEELLNRYGELMRRDIDARRTYARDSNSLAADMGGGSEETTSKLNDYLAKFEAGYQTELAALRNMLSAADKDRPVLRDGQVYFRRQQNLSTYQENANAVDKARSDRRQLMQAGQRIFKELFSGIPR